jgi:hypothetical protein
MLTAVASLLESVYIRDPYHTSALTGEAWVVELLSGHPEHMQTALGVNLHVFSALILELRAAGYKNSKHVSLEEQLAIFLYACVTGLTIRHLGEHFQRSNETISRLELFFYSLGFYNLVIIISAIFDECSLSFLRNHSTANMYNSQEPTVEFYLRSATIPSSGHFLRMPSVH